MTRAMKLLLVICLPAVQAITCAAGVTGENVIAAVKKRYAEVNDYRADVTLTVKGPKISVKGMRMTVYYKKPNKVHVEAKSGVAVVPQGTFFGSPIEELANSSDPVYVKSERKNGRECHVIRLDAPNKPPTTLWIDKERSVVVATEVSGDLGTKSAWSYVRVDGKYYLPTEITAEMRAPGGQNGVERSRLTVKFGNYRVNKGISDKVFEERPTNKK